MKTNFLDNKKEVALIERVNQVFVAHGLKAVTMDDMAKRLNVSKKTLYKYVKNRKELVYKSTVFHIAKDKESVEAILAKNLDPISELHEIAQFVLLTISQINPKVHYDLEHYFTDSWELIDEYFNGFLHTTYLNNLLKGRDSGFYRDDFNPEIVAKIFTSKMDLVWDAKVFNPEKYPFGEVYLEYLLYHLRSIVSNKGMDLLNKLDFKTLY